MNILWIGGWGIPPESPLTIIENHWPEVSHQYETPSSDCLVNIRKQRYDYCVAYSLGGFLLLRDQWYNHFEVRKKTFVLTPFLDYRKESGLGGKISITQLKFLLRLLKKKPLPAIADFYKTAKLNLDLPNQLPYDINELTWGIEQLATTSIEESIPKHIKLLAGENDPLIDNKILQSTLTQLQLVPEADHNLSSFFNLINFE